QTGIRRLEHGLGFPPVDADPEALDDAVTLQIRHRALPALVGDPRVAPHVELLQVDAIDTEVLPAALGHFDDVVVWEDVLDRRLGAARPSAVLSRPFWCDK